MKKLILALILYAGVANAQQTSIIPKSGSASSGASGITIDVSVITGGTDTRFLYDKAGVVGESATFTTATVPTLSATQSFTGVNTFSLDAASTNTVLYPYLCQRTSSGTAAIGLGCGTQFILENASGSNVTAGEIHFAWSDPVNATEDANWILKTIQAGTLSQALKYGVTTFGAAANPALSFGTLSSAGSIRADTGGGGLFFGRADTANPTAWIGSTGFVTSSTGIVAFDSGTLSDGGNVSPDTYLTREAAATVQLGQDVNGAAVAQTIKSHDGITGTDIAGANFTVAGGRGTGAGAPGKLVFQTGTTLGTGTTAQTLATRAEISESGIVGQFDDSSTNTVLYPFTCQRTSTGTAAIGLGCGTSYTLENASGTNKTAGSSDIVWLDPVNATEDADWSLRLMTAGAAAAEVARITSTSHFSILNPGGALVEVIRVSGGVVTLAAGGGGTAAGGAFRVGAASLLGFSTRGGFLSPTDGVITTTYANGSTAGWIQNSAGDSVLNADYTNATTTFSNMAFSKTVISGRAYAFSMSLHLTESTAADGVKIDFNGGTAAMTHFVVSCVLTNNLGAIVTQANAISTALATVINATATVTTAQHLYQCQGGFVPSGNGTFIARAAQDSHSAGTLTVLRDSSLMVNDVVAQ